MELLRQCVPWLALGVPPLILKFRIATQREGIGRLASFLLSVALHVGCVAILLALGGPPDKQRVAVVSAVVSLRDKSAESSRVFWFRRSEQLPPVNSGERKTAVMPTSRPNPKQIVFTTPRARTPQKQFIFLEAPTVAQQPPIQSPNLLLLAGPSLAATLPQAVPPPVKRFKPPEQTPPARSAPVDMTEGMPEVARSTQLEFPLPAPSVAVTDPKLPRPPAKKFTPPSGGGRATATEQGALLDPPPPLVQGSGLPGQATGSDRITLAVISANPSTMALPPSPKGNRTDTVHLGGVSGGVKDGSGGGEEGATVPGLTIRKVAKKEEPRTGAMTVSDSDSSSANAAVPTRPTTPPPFVNTPTVSVPQWPNARRIPAIVEAAFPDRPVFATVVTVPGGGMPDWVLWFGEMVPSAPGTRVFMRPPVPMQLHWTASSRGWPEKLWVRAHLTRDGSLSSITISPSGDAETDAAVAQSLSRWRFSPAVRNGVVVDSDVFLEMTFRHAR